MDRQKPKKGNENRKLHCNGFDFSSNDRVSYNEKNKYKKYSDKKKYDMSPNSYSMNWSPQPRFHPMAQRQYSTSDSSVCHYPVPLGFAFEPVSLPIYPALIQPQGNCAAPFELEPHNNRSKNHKKHKNKFGVCKASSVVQNDAPPNIFHTPKLISGDQQDYASLPPVNCDMYAAKFSDPEAVCKRRFSDPGIGQISSDDCSSSRSDDASKSSGTTELQIDVFNLVEQMNELKENNSKISKELNETKMELESFKMQSLTWKIGSEDFKPGALSDAISEIRSAVKLNEEALESKVIQLLEKNFIECKEAREKLEEKLKAEMNEKLNKLRDQLNKSSPPQEPADASATGIPQPPPKNKDSDVQQIAELERENFQLRKELQEAVAKRKTAEAATEKLERLVGILRKKINGVSLESCITDDKHILVRPLASSLEKNPFIIANNRQTHKSDTLPFSKAKIPPFRGFILDNPEGATVLMENKENENLEVGGGGGSGCGSGSSESNFGHPPSDASVTAQVTMTGPVTDL